MINSGSLIANSNPNRTGHRPAYLIRVRWVYRCRLLSSSIKGVSQPQERTPSDG